ncbi:MAG: hypothetical protein QXY54_03210 [Nitrososphaerota archaeon]
MLVAGVMILSVISSLIISMVLSGLLAHHLRSPRFMGVDVHKPEKPRIPKIGGLALAAAYGVVMLMNMLVGGGSAELVLLVSPLIAAVIGLLEDARELNPLAKPLLLLLPALPVLLLSTYNPYPIIPIIGGVRITLIYPILVLVAYTVVANAINSVDVLNGSLALSALPILLLLAALSWLEGVFGAATACLVLSAALLGFLRYNWYPAKIFGGNVGSNLVAAVVTTVAIVARLEVVTMVALLPHILNEFFIIVSMGGLKSGKSLASRPIEFVSGLIVASRKPSDPLTLVRLIASQRPMSEVAISKSIAVISIYSSLLAAATYLIGRLTA